MKIILYGIPKTKKNSQRIIDTGNGRALIQSKAYRQYERDCIDQMRFMKPVKASEAPFNAQYVYYMPDDRRVDLVNLIEATNDILVNGGVLPEDNKKVIAAHDGCRVMIDKTLPRVEIMLTSMEEKNDG